jgi:hypothetical protein
MKLRRDITELDDWYIRALMSREFRMKDKDTRNQELDQRLTSEQATNVAHNAALGSLLNNLHTRSSELILQAPRDLYTQGARNWWEDIEVHKPKLVVIRDAARRLEKVAKYIAVTKQAIAQNVRVRYVETNGGSHIMEILFPDELFRSPPLMPVIQLPDNLEVIVPADALDTATSEDFAGIDDIMAIHNSAQLDIAIAREEEKIRITEAEHAELVAELTEAAAVRAEATVDAVLPDKDSKMDMEVELVEVRKGEPYTAKDKGEKDDCIMMSTVKVEKADSKPAADPDFETPEGDGFKKLKAGYKTPTDKKPKVRALFPGLKPKKSVNDVLRKSSLDIAKDERFERLKLNAILAKEPFDEEAVRARIYGKH